MLHILCIQLKIPDCQIFLHPFPVYRFRYHDHSLLYIPAQDDLCRRLTIFLSDFLQHRLPEHSFQPFCKGSPCFRLDAQLFHQLEILSTLVMRVTLDLINLRFDPGIAAQIQQTVRQEITDPDSTYFSFPVEVFKRPPGPIIVSKGHVDQIQIQIIQPQLFQGPFKSLYRTVISHFLNIGFGCDKKFLPGNPAVSYRPSYSLLILIRTGRIDQAVPCFYCFCDNLFAVSLRYLKNTEAFHWH